MINEIFGKNTIKLMKNNDKKPLTIKNFKNIVLPLILLGTMSCSISNNNISSVKLNDISNVKIVKEKNNYIVDLGHGKKGADLSIVLDSPEIQNTFSTKNSVDGKKEKLITDIRSYAVYLTRSTSNSGYVGTDPLNDIGPLSEPDFVSGPFNIDKDGSNLTPTAPDTTSYHVITFKNLPSSGPYYYYAVVRAFDAVGGAGGSGNDLIKPNFGATWTGTTAATPAISISNNGRKIDSNLVIRNDLDNPDLSPLLITPPLLDIVGASLETSITPIAGSGITIGPPIISNTGGFIELNAGNGSAVFFGDTGQAKVAGLNTPGDVAIDATGNLYIADTTNHRIRKVDTAGVITTFAGNGTPCALPTNTCGDGGLATSANLKNPSSVVLDSTGNLYIADTGDNKIRKVDTGGNITTVVGTGNISLNADSSGITNNVKAPEGLAIDSSNNLYISDTGHHIIKKLNAGSITTLAGDGSAGYLPDPSVLLSAEFNFPKAIAVNPAGTKIYVADTGNNLIREITTDVKTFAGDSNLILTSGGDGGQANLAGLNAPTGVGLDTLGNVFISDTNNNKIRKVNIATNVISTIAGTGANTPYLGDDISAITTTLKNPKRLKVDANGNVYFADTNNHRVRKLL